MSRLKVAILTDYLARLSGTEASVVATAEALVRAGDEVRIYCYCVDGEPHPYWAAELRELHVAVLAQAPSVPPEEFCNVVAADLRGWRPDVAHAIPIDSFAARCTLLRVLLPDLPLLGTLTSEPSSRCTWYSDQNLLNFPRYSAVLAPAECIADGLRTRFGYHGRLVVIPHIVRVPEIEMTSSRVTDLGRLQELGSITRLRVEKGTDFMIAAVAILKRSFPEVSLTIYGETPELERTRELARGLGVERELVIAGPFRGSSEISAVIRRHPIFILSSLFESMPLALMEVLARGRAIVATDVGATRELLEGLPNARLVPAGDPRAMAEAVAELLARPELLLAGGRLAIQRFRQRYGAERVVDRLRYVYGELAGVSAEIAS